MFDLEQAISEWRQQMLATGIKSPVPLEELELHLREEIGRQMKSETDARRAFEISVQRIGRASVLKDEFETANVKILNWKIGARIFLAFALINAVFDILAFSHVIHGGLVSIVWWVFNAPSLPLAVICLRHIQTNPAGFVCFIIFAGLVSALVWSVVGGFIFRRKNTA